MALALARPALGALATIKVAALATVMAGVAHLVHGLAGLEILPARPTIEFWILALASVIAEGRPFTTPGAVPHRTSATHLSVCFTFAIMLLWGPGPAIVVQTLAVATAALRQRLGLSRGLVTAARLAAALVAATIAFRSVGPLTMSVGDPLNQTDVVAVLAAATAWFVVNYALVAIELRVRYQLPWRRLFTQTLARELLSTGALLLLAPLLVSVPTGWVFVLILVPVIAVSQMARLSSEQEALVRIDPLSGLLSRRALAAEVNDITERGRRHRGSSTDGRFALMLIDLDHFKSVNDALGHAVGDQLLAEVADRLADAVRPGDIVARLGGDEFAVVALRTPSVAHARAIAARIGSRLREPLYLEGLPLDVSASIGIATYPDDGRDFTTLMRHADVAMYEAKRSSADVTFYNAATDNNSPDQLALLADLRLALTDPRRGGEITLEYQPQVAIGTGEVIGVEALLRWHHRVRGDVCPTEIVRTAENSAVMQLLTFRIVDQAVAQLAAWHKAGIGLRASINVSVRDLHTPDVVDHLRRTLSREGISPDRIEIEITETALMADPERVSATVRRLAELGVGVSLDDFGTGYSSLLHLRGLPLSEVKIDQSFIRSMATNPNDAAIVRSIIDLSHTLGLLVVAEGVEDAEITRLLADAHCDLAQGWHYGPAMPPNTFVDWLVNRRYSNGAHGVAAADTSG